MKFRKFVHLLALFAAANAFAQSKPLALSGHAEALGNGSDGTVMGIVFQIAPEDRERAGGFGSGRLQLYGQVTKSSTGSEGW